MKKTAAHDTTNLSSESAPSPGSLRIGRAFADTTWRIAVPVLLGTGAGIALDRWLGSKPWLTLLGTALGFVAAGWLVKQELGGELEDQS